MIAIDQFKQAIESAGLTPPGTINDRWSHPLIQHQRTARPGCEPTANEGEAVW